MRNAQNRNQLPLSKLRLFLISRRQHLSAGKLIPTVGTAPGSFQRVKAILCYSTDLASFLPVPTFPYNSSYYDTNCRSLRELLQGQQFVSVGSRLFCLSSVDHADLLSGDSSLLQ